VACPPEETEVSLLPLRTTADVHVIESAVLAMAQGMRAARAQARVGDIFSDEIAAFFRAEIAEILREDKISVAELLAEIEYQNETGENSSVLSPPAVHKRFL
jgi:hypothetical protein